MQFTHAISPTFIQGLEGQKRPRPSNIYWETFMTDRVRVSFDLPRHLAVGLELVGMADGVSRNDVLHRAAARAVSEAGLMPSLERLTPRRRK